MTERKIGLRTPQLEPELATSDPEAFKRLAIKSIGERSVLGDDIWQHVVAAGVVRPEKVSLDTATWVSRSNARGDITIGTQPVDAVTKDKVMFRNESLTYPDEIAYKVLHEAMHSFLFLVQSSDEAKPLRRAAAEVRNRYSGIVGLTALGSLDFYSGESKVTEDTTELMTMYAWDPALMAEYAVFLGDPSQKKTRDRTGLVAISGSAVLYDLVAQAVDGNLAKSK